MRSVLACYGNQAVVRDLNIETQRLATHGIYTDTSSRSIYENVGVYQALEDGFRVSHGNDFSAFRNCSARICGTIWHTAGYAGPSPANLRVAVTGTCSVPSALGSAYGRVVTFSNLSVPLTSMGLRRGDWISVDPTAPGHEGAMFWAPILSVDSASQLTLRLTRPGSGKRPPGALERGFSRSAPRTMKSPRNCLARLVARPSRFTACARKTDI